MMPRRITSMMGLVAAMGIVLGAFLAVGRWYGALSDPEQASINFLRTVFLGYVAVFGAIIVPIFVTDAIRDALGRRREALATRLARAEGSRQES